MEAIIGVPWYILVPACVCIWAKTWSLHCVPAADPSCKAKVVSSLLFIKDAGKILPFLINQTHAHYNWR